MYQDLLQTLNKIIFNQQSKLFSLLYSLLKLKPYLLKQTFFVFTSRKTFFIIQNYLNNFQKSEQKEISINKCLGIQIPKNKILLASKAIQFQCKNFSLLINFKIKLLIQRLLQLYQIYDCYLFQCLKQIFIPIRNISFYNLYISIQQIFTFQIASSEIQEIMKQNDLKQRNTTFFEKAIKKNFQIRQLNKVIEQKIDQMETMYKNIRQQINLNQSNLSNLITYFHDYKTKLFQAIISLSKVKSQFLQLTQKNNLVTQILKVNYKTAQLLQDYKQIETFNSSQDQDDHKLLEKHNINDFNAQQALQKIYEQRDKNQNLQLQRFSKQQSISKPYSQRQLFNKQNQIYQRNSLFQQKSSEQSQIINKSAFIIDISHEHLKYDNQITNRQESQLHQKSSLDYAKNQGQKIQEKMFSQNYLKKLQEKSHQKSQEQSQDKLQKKSQYKQQEKSLESSQLEIKCTVQNQNNSSEVERSLEHSNSYSTNKKSIINFDKNIDEVQQLHSRIQFNKLNQKRVKKQMKKINQKQQLSYSQILNEDKSIHNDIRLFDHLSFQQKKKLFEHVCKVSSSVTTKRSQIKTSQIYTQYFFQVITQKKIHIQILQQLKNNQPNLCLSIVPKIILLLLYRKQNVPKNIKLGDMVQKKIIELQAADKQKRIQNWIEQNNQNFYFDKNFDDKENKAVFKLSVYFILEKAYSFELNYIIKKIFDQSIEQQMQNLIDNEEKEQQEIIIKQMNQQISKDNVEGILDPIKEPQKMLTKNEIIDIMNNSKLFNGCFLIYQQQIVFNVRSRPNESNTPIDIDSLIDMQYLDQVSTFFLHMRILRTQGLNKLSKVCINTKILYIWDCHIQTLEGSGLQRLTKLKILSLSNNPLKKDSVDYLIKFQKTTWLELKQLRITFRDGSQSYDKFIPQIKKIFPSLKQLHLRQLHNVQHHTFLLLKKLSQFGIQVNFRLEERIIPNLLRGGYKSIDLSYDNDIAHFSRIDKIIIQNQQIIKEDLKQALKNKLQCKESQCSFYKDLDQ